MESLGSLFRMNTLSLCSNKVNLDGVDSVAKHTKSKIYKLLDLIGNFEYYVLYINSNKELGLGRKPICSTADLQWLDNAVFLKGKYTPSRLMLHIQKVEKVNTRQDINMKRPVFNKTGISVDEKVST